MKYYLGIDVGSSKTHALIAEESGKCIGFGKAWGGNHQTYDYDGLANALLESFGQAVQAAGVDKARIRWISYGKERPFVLGHDESAWRWNRRAHFAIE